MKIITFITAFALTVGTLFGQEMSANFNVEFESDDPQMQMQLGMLSNSTYKMFVKNEMSRTEMNMGGMNNSVTITDTKKQKGIILIDGIVGKIAAEMDKKSFEEKDDIEIEFEETDETKEILGYTCKKVVGYGENSEVIYWVTEDIEMPKGTMGDYVKGDLEGFPLAFSIINDQITINFTATEMKEKVKEEKGMFSLKIPSGYTKKSFEEISKMGM